MDKPKKKHTYEKEVIQKCLKLLQDSEKRDEHIESMIAFISREEKTIHEQLGNLMMRVQALELGINKPTEVQQSSISSGYVQNPNGSYRQLDFVKK